MSEKKIRGAQIWIIAGFLLIVILLRLLDRPSAPADSAQKYARSADLNGQPLAVVTGSAYADYAEADFPASDLIYVTDWADTAILVAQGKAEGFLTERADSEAILAEYQSLTILPDAVGRTEFTFVTRHGDEGAALAKEFNAFLSAYKADGSYDALHQKWVEPADGEPILEPCASDGSRGVLSVATCDDWVPYAYLSNNKNTGLFLDLTYRFCEWAGYAPKMEILPPNIAFTGVAAGKYDLLAYGCVASPERAEEVCFTDPLEGDDVLMVVRKDAFAGDAGESGAGSDGSTDNFFSGLVKSFEKNFIREDRWKMMLSGLLVTLALALCAAVLGTILGSIVCFLHFSRSAFAVGFARLYIKLFQGMPIVVLLLILYYVVFGKTDISAFIVCALGFSLDFSAYAAEIFRSGIEAVPLGQRRAALALGFGKSSAFFNIVLPQALRHILPVYRGQFVSMVKTTAVAGYIAVQDLTKASDIIRSRTYEALFPLILTAVIYFLLAALMVSALRLIEIRTDPYLRDRKPKGVKL